jgi:xanthine dehydrogenase YagR molybdenum-binding subunit
MHPLQAAFIEHAEVARCGVAPAISNAVYHATGKRIRERPITLEKVLV